MNCNVVIGIQEQEVVTFINVREVLFRPRTSYTHHFSSELMSAQKVIYTEMIEHGEKCCTEMVNVSNHFVFPITDLPIEEKLDVNKPSTSSDSGKPIIRVAAFASESLMIDENRIIKHFQDALMSEIDFQSQSSENQPTAIWCSPAESDVATKDRVDKLDDHGLKEFPTEEAVVEAELDCSGFDLNFFDNL